MWSLRKFTRLSGAERRVLIEALTLSAGVRLGLKLFPLRTVRRWLRRLGEGNDRRCPESEPRTIERIVWAVQATNRGTPGATCLVQAMTGQVLLRRRGIPASVQIGVTKDGVEGFQAHAWLESDGTVLIGGSEDLADRYERLTALDD